MQRNEAVTAIESALTEVLEREVSGTEESARLFEDLHLDSTSVLELLMSLEDLVGIEVDPDELDADDFRTVGTLTDFLLTAKGSPADEPLAARG
ncbi:phosphopantetheine-binding protein [Streptomyces physcomitrii]|uniref:Acyl carrier protein n=1 Tax=Streptomyces physcomitrii TaxID=2724184 RepID=A0ABX1H6V9_9ACTN|nr:phosphopantetheine-binding protein [Streptomyces physcomitrii]NKI42979.1 acyl carrier protein [Streptomyces physcomitrii]